MVKARTVTERVKKRLRKPLMLNDLLDMLGDEEENIRLALLDYYQSPKGLQDISNSPHKGRTPEEVVEDLMKEVRALKGRG